MAAPSHALYPGELWHEAQRVFGGSRAANPLYCKHDAHVSYWKSFKHLRQYRHRYDDEAHVAVFEKRVKAKLKRMTEKRGECLLWVGRMFNNTPRMNVDYKNEQHPIGLYQRLAHGVKLPQGHLWGRATCEHKDCIEHRAPISESDLKRVISNEVKHRASYRASRIRSGCSRSTLTVEKVLEMKRLRAEEKLTYKEIGDRVGESEHAARDVCAGRRWAHVTQQRTAMTFMASQLLGAQQ